MIMKIYFTREFSFDVLYLSDLVEDIQQEVSIFFKDLDYGEDLKVIYISLFCMSDKFIKFFKIRKPKYRKNFKTYMHKGVQLETEPYSFFYELRLDHSKYVNEKNSGHENLASDIIQSLNAIETCSSIKEFDLLRFKQDFNRLFSKI
jgi:hypothetical protein